MKVKTISGKRIAVSYAIMDYIKVSQLTGFTSIIIKDIKGKHHLINLNTL